MSRVDLNLFQLLGHEAYAQARPVLPVHSPFEHRTLTTESYPLFTKEDLLAPRGLQENDIDDPNIKHYFFSLDQLVDVFPFLRNAFESTVRIAGRTGFLISSKGHVLTNAHVVESMILGTSDHLEAGVNISLDTKECVILSDGKSMTLKGAEIIHIGDDRKEPDVAIIRIPSLAGRKFIELSRHETEIGERIFLIGNPSVIGEQVISIGVVRGHSNVPNIRTGFIHLDCLSYGGNSGGPLIDLFGNCVGLFKASGLASGGIFLSIPPKDLQNGQRNESILQSISVDSSTILEILKSKGLFPQV